MDLGALALASGAPLALVATARAALGRAWRGPLRPGWSREAELYVAVVRSSMLASRILGHRWLRAVTDAQPVSASLRAAVERQEVDAGGVPAVWFRPRSGAASRSVIYLHGGGYVTGSPRSYAELVSRIALEVEAEVLALDYRRSPEHRFPAAQDDCLAATRWLLERGVSPERLGLAGDSAGGGLVLATLTSLRDAGESLPAAAWLISPWVDPLARGGSIDRFAKVDILSPGLVSDWAALHASGDALQDPRLRAVGARLDGLPPLLVHAGGAELFHDSILAFCDRAERAGVAVELEVGPEQVHDYPLMGGRVAEGTRARETATRWLREQLGGSA